MDAWSLRLLRSHQRPAWLVGSNELCSLRQCRSASVNSSSTAGFFRSSRSSGSKPKFPRPTRAGSWHHRREEPANRAKRASGRIPTAIDQPRSYLRNRCHLQRANLDWLPDKHLARPRENPLSLRARRIDPRLARRLSLTTLQMRANLAPVETDRSARGVGTTVARVTLLARTLGFIC